MVVKKRGASGSRGMQKAGNGADHQADGRSNGEAQSGTDWINGSWVATQQAVDWVSLFQRTLLQFIVTWNEALTTGLAEMGKASNPMQIWSAESGGASRQMDAVASQQAGLMQLMFDSQLNLFNKLFREVEPSQAASSQAEYGQDILSAWGKAQDEWMTATKGILDAMSPAQAGR